MWLGAEMLSTSGADYVPQPHIIVVNSVIITLWLEISGAVLKGETIQSAKVGQRNLPLLYASGQRSAAE
ncbi:uncharacterized [Tachysurus ichikawai]